MHVIQVSTKALKAAAHVSAQNDIRYYLNSVYVQATPTETLCVATDGHHMIAVRQAAQNEVSEPISIIIPIEVIKILTKGRKKGGQHMISLVFENGKWTAPLPEYGHLQFTAIEANYPNWRQVTPKEPSGEADHYNVRLLRNLQDAATELGAMGRFPVTLTQNGNGAALVTCDGTSDFEMVGIIMPYRADSVKAAGVPGWAVFTEQAEEELEAAA